MCRILARGMLVAAALVCFVPCPSQAEDAPATLVPLDELTEKLEKSLDSRFDIELKTGESYLRCKLLKVTAGDKKGPPKVLKFQDGDSPKPLTMPFVKIRSISVDREEIYQAPATTKKTGKEAAFQRESKAAAAEREKWVATAKARGMKIWPELTAEEHKADEKKTRETIAKIKEKFPNTELYETHEFLFVSDMPRDQVVPYAASLDKMYDMMCQMYGIKKGTAVWKGKCLIVAFLNKEDFSAYEQIFFNRRQSTDAAQGLCHQNSAGDVVISCYRGDDYLYFGQVLVHETSHGFIHRYRTTHHMPSWVNEGMAEWIAQALVQNPGGVARKREQALTAMQQSHSMLGMFNEEQISAIQYGMATTLTDFLIIKDKRKYAQWVNGMKEGKTWEESLKDAYGVTTAELLSAFGQAIGVPDLRP